MHPYGRESPSPFVVAKTALGKKVAAFWHSFEELTGLIQCLPTFDSKNGFLSGLGSTNEVLGTSFKFQYRLGS